MLRAKWTASTAITVPLVVPYVLRLFPGLDHFVMNALFRGGFWTLEFELPRLTIVAGWLLRNLCVTPLAVPFGFCLRALADGHLGRTQRAVKGADAMLRTIRATYRGGLEPRVPRCWT